MKRIRLEFLKGIILVYFDFYGKNVKKKKAKIPQIKIYVI